MSERSISLHDLLNLSIGPPNTGAVDFTALHQLLHAVLRQLGLRETKVRWKDSKPVAGGGGHPEPRLKVSGTVKEEEREEEDGNENEEEEVYRTPAEDGLGAELLDWTPFTGTAVNDQERLRYRIESCEDGVTKVRDTAIT